MAKRLKFESRILDFAKPETVEALSAWLNQDWTIWFEQYLVKKEVLFIFCKEESKEDENNN